MDLPLRICYTADGRMHVGEQTGGKTLCGKKVASWDATDDPGPAALTIMMNVPLGACQSCADKV